MKPHSLVPMAFVRSVSGSIEFYRKLGFEVGRTHAPEGRTDPVFAWIQSDHAHLMLSQATEPIDPKKQAVLFYVYCADVAVYRSELLAVGVDASPIEYPFWAPRGEFQVVDPDGYCVMISHT